MAARPKSNKFQEVVFDWGDIKYRRMLIQTKFWSTKKFMVQCNAINIFKFKRIRCGDGLFLRLGSSLQRSLRNENEFVG